jgi:two-component system, chemotaxis family, protein-glutamate methylesterase/glutaminase
MQEKVRVLVVDDSSFFRKRIREELERTGDITVVGEAADGREAVSLAQKLTPDLITMDVAMPVMDGITAVREIMARCPTRIMMFSALTRDGARATLEALDAGAVDFMPKPGGQETDAVKHATLSQRVLGIVRRQSTVRAAPSAHVDPPSAAVRRREGLARLQLVVIGASTGGPVAIQQVLAALPADYPLAVLVAVHMPGEFTATFAERLDSICRIRVRQAADGDRLVPQQVLVAPGGKQTEIERRGPALCVRVTPGGEHLYKPSIDLTFGSAARPAGDGVHAVILTGMGADGTEGARLLKQQRAMVWSQDQATSVVYGMPMSVVRAGCSDRVLALPEIGPALAGLV